jgi:hypothetical protein
MAALIVWMLYWGQEFQERSMTAYVKQVYIAAEFQVLRPPSDMSAVDFAPIQKTIMENQRQSAAFARETVADAVRSMEDAEHRLVDWSAIAAAILALGWLFVFASRFRFRIEHRETAATS